MVLDGPVVAGEGAVLEVAVVGGPVARTRRDDLATEEEVRILPQIVLAARVQVLEAELGGGRAVE